MHKMEQAPEKFDTELITLLLKSSETTTFSPQERAKYLHDMTTKRDIENYISYARKEGVQQEKLESARKMKELGADMNFICQVSGLTPEQVAAL